MLRRYRAEITGQFIEHTLPKDKRVTQVSEEGSVFVLLA